MLAVCLPEFLLALLPERGQRSECLWGGSSLGPGPTVVVVAEGRYFAVSALVIVVGDSKTTKYLQVLVLI